LINAHYHSGEAFNPGLYENLPLDLWFVHSHQVSRLEPPSQDAIYARTMVGAMLMLKNGISSVVDFLFEAPEISPEVLEPVIRAYRDSGMRATVLLGVADRSFADSLPLTDEQRASWSDEAAPPSLERIMSVAVEAVDRWHEPDGLIGIGMGPSAPQRCSAALMARSLELCSSRGLAWQTHVLETKTQALTAREWHGGRSFIEVLAERGQLNASTTLVHTVWLSDRDVELLAGHGTTIVHCPASNLRLGDGVAPIPALSRAGVNIALGTDGRGCDEALDLLEIVRLTALLNKARGADHREWLSASRAFQMATGDASVTTGHGQRLGRIEPGALGDLVVIPSDGAAFVPLHDPLRQLVFGASGRDVRDVVVAGEVVVRERRLTRVDEAQLLDGARRLAREELAAAPAEEAAAQRLETLLEGLAQRARAADLGFDSYLPRDRGELTAGS
jgi:cytosine/adenosine deaminase-related metal-dependent hydrolase